MIVTLLMAFIEMMMTQEVHINGSFMFLETLCWCMIAITIKFVWFA